MTNKVNAMALMLGLNVHAMHGGFYEQHTAILCEPTAYNYDRVRAAISRNPNSTSGDDQRLSGVYSCWYEINRSMDTDTPYYYGRLQLSIASWQECRFPSAADTRDRFGREVTRILDRLRPVKTHIYDIAKAVGRHRVWHDREQNRGDLHPAVFRACDYARPADLVQLVLEWPRASKEGQHKIAYTRDERYGEADRQTTTSVAKYLTRHFPALSSDRIRDISARYCEASFHVITTMQEILHAIITGPGSCMAYDADHFSRLDGRHPYEAYDPKHGWSMAVIKERNRVTGRALLNDNKWVRTYRMREDDSGNRTAYSDVDERLTAWLGDNGYQRVNGWRGFRLARLDATNNCGFVAPYIDGSDQHVDDHGSSLRIVNSGEYACNNTNGDADVLNSTQCEDCDDRISDDDTYYVYRNDDRCVCENCRDQNYTYVYGRDGDRYYVDNDDAVCVGDEYYDSRFLEHNNIVCTYDGDYYHNDDAVYIESASEYYPAESDLICCTEEGEWELREDCVELENGEWCLRDDAWQCEHTGDYYASVDHDPVTTKCGKIVHPDHANQYEVAEA